MDKEIISGSNSFNRPFKIDFRSASPAKNNSGTNVGYEAVWFIVHDKIVYVSEQNGVVISE